jgi:hypothetical protein
MKRKTNHSHNQNSSSNNNNNNKRNKMGGCLSPPSPTDQKNNNNTNGGGDIDNPQQQQSSPNNNNNNNDPTAAAAAATATTTSTTLGEINNNNIPSTQNLVTRQRSFHVGLNSEQSGGGYLTFENIAVKCPIGAEWTVRFDFTPYNKRPPCFVSLYKSNLYYTKHPQKPFLAENFKTSSPFLRATVMSTLLSLHRLKIANSNCLQILAYFEDYETLPIDDSSNDEEEEEEEEEEQDKTNIKDMIDVKVRMGNGEPYPTVTLEIVLQNNESKPTVLYSQRHTFSTMATIWRDNQIAMSEQTDIHMEDYTYVDR